MESQNKKRDISRKRRKLRIGKKLRSSPQRYRLSVYKSNRHIYAQIVDDESQIVLGGAGTQSKSFREKNAKCKSKESARIIGEAVAKIAKEHKVESLVFDRGPWKYHGIIAELADAARQGGLKF